MTRKKVQEPKQDWGFYAVTPRIVRTQYKKLSHAEKWLYTCLKDLCGDKGSCFRSLRSLSEETDISIASLSKMIPNLHKFGLIHAEKKRSPRSGKEVWHISIVDIWAENAKYCRGCSENEQTKEENSEVVQNSNNVVQNSNKTDPVCSKNEQSVELGCSNFSDIRISKNNGTEERMNGTNDSTNPKDLHSPTHSLSSLSTEELMAELNRRQKEQLPSQESLLSSEEQRIHGYWQGLGLEADITPKLKEHWGKLTDRIQTFGQFKSLYEHTRQQIENNPEIKNKRVNPGNLTNTNNLNGWKQAQQEQQQSSEPKEEKKSVLGVSGLPLCMSDPSEPRLEYRFQRGKPRRRVVAQ